MPYTANYMITLVTCQAPKGYFGCFLRFDQIDGGIFVFYDRFAKLCDQKGVSRTKACVDCGISRTAWHKWEDGATPNGATINKFAAYFNVAVGSLLEEEKNNPPGELVPTEREAKILEALRSKTPAERKALLTLLGISED